MALESGTLLRDRYVIKQQLGQGGMGAVYLAEDTALDQLVAVKANLNTSELGQRQFEMEARLLAKLRHSNLPLVFDHFIIDDVQYLVMDYIPGENLNDRIKDDGPQAVYKVLEWAEQIADALTYLHSQNPPVIHRDIKPANLKITPSGQIVLVDFGIAKANEGETTVGARGYSPGYAPPEQYSNATTGPYSDQYSFAATLYALLTGSPPPESVDLMLGQNTLVSTRAFGQNIPIHVDVAIQRAMSVEPDKRYASVKEFITALTDPAALAEATIRPDDRPTIVKPKEDKTLVAPKPGTVPKPDTASKPGTVPKKTSKLPIALIGGAVVVVILAVIGILALSNGKTPVAAADTETPTVTEAVAILPSDTPEQEATDVPVVVEPSATPTFTLAPTETFTPTPQPTPLGSGGKIAFVSDRNGGYDQIYVMDPDGSNITQLTFDEVDKSWPMWSPDGTKIMYVADGGPGPYASNYDLDVWVMDADGQNQIDITLYQAKDYDPVWTPDGSKIVFVTDRYGGARLLAIMNADGSDLRRLGVTDPELLFEEYNPTFSPDGETLMVTGTFFHTLTIRSGGGFNDPELFDVRWSEGDRTNTGIEPAWSPDGEWIVYIRTKDNVRQLYLIEEASRGATMRRLEMPGLNYDPAWSPDSNWIVVTNAQNGNQDIYIMDKGGRFLQNLTDNPAMDKMPSWKPVP